MPSDYDNDHKLDFQHSVYVHRFFINGNDGMWTLTRIAVQQFQRRDKNEQSTHPDILENINFKFSNINPRVIQARTATILNKIILSHRSDMNIFLVYAPRKSTALFREKKYKEEYFSWSMQPNGRWQ